MEKYLFELSKERSADIFASLMITGTSLIEAPSAEIEQVGRGLDLILFANEWQKMFVSQHMDTNTPSTETKN
jgi:hypothetical protein